MRQITSKRDPSPSAYELHSGNFPFYTELNSVVKMEWEKEDVRIQYDKGDLSSHEQIRLQAVTAPQVFSKPSHRERKFRRVETDLRLFI